MGGVAPAPQAPAAGALMVVLLTAAVTTAAAGPCGFRAGGQACPDQAECCSIYGWCGTSSAYCGEGNCVSGACEGPPVAAPKGCDGTCLATADDGQYALAECRAGLSITSITDAIYGSAAEGCKSDSSLSGVEEVCLGEEQCYVAATYETFGEDPCPEQVAKTLQFLYTCGQPPQSPEPGLSPMSMSTDDDDIGTMGKGSRAVFAVEGKRAIARCPKGQVISAITDAFYGKYNRRCKAKTSYRIVARSCLGSRLCAPLATDKFFRGDPCPRVRPKILYFQYKCAPKQWRLRGTATAMEGRRAKAECPPGYKIGAIPGVFYGRYSERCFAPASRSAVSRSCLGSRICTPPATDKFFGGDPCPRISPKVLWFKYRCIKRKPQQTLPTDPPPLPPIDDGSSNTAGQRSLLWGDAGERWSPDSRIPDWSYAGYMGNERPIPDYPVRINVKDAPFNARGDGETDDTDAIIAAIEKASEIAAEFTTEPCGRNNERRCKTPHKGFQNEGRQGVAVLVPAGTYVITKMIEIHQSNVVLRGEGPGKTVLYYPKGLQRIYGNKMAWAYMGGLLVLHGLNFDSNDRDFFLTDVSRGLVKGQRRIQVESTRGIEEGQWVRLFALTPYQRANRRTLLQEFDKLADPGARQLLGAGWPSNATRASQAGSARQQVPPAHPGSGRPSSPRLLNPELHTGARAPPGAPAGLRRPGPSIPGTRAAPPSRPKPSQPPRQNPAPSRSGLLPMPVAFIRGKRDADAIGLGRPEHGDAREGVFAAAADGTLDAYLYGNNLASSATPYNGERIRFASRVRRVGDGWVELERPLPYDVRIEWRPALYSFATPLQHSGFEGFTMKFKHEPYPSHFSVPGFNGIWVYGSANCWARDIEFINADTGAEAQNSDFVTLKSLTFGITAPRGNTFTQDSDGHHGAWAAASSNVHITGFTFNSRFIHDLTMDVMAQECVFNNGRGVDMSLDMHRSAVHNNLWSNIDVGAGTRPFLSSGQSIRGAHAAANNTWWNIYSSTGKKLPLPDCDFGPLLNFIGSYAPPADSPRAGGEKATDILPQYCPQMLWRTERYVADRRSVDPPRFAPADLLSAMVTTRRRRLEL